METRIKKSRELLWGTGIVFLVVLILTIFVHAGWWLAVIMGILLVVELILYQLNKDNDLVIDDRGIHQVKGVDYKWYQINHCYLASRLEGSYGRYSGPYRSTYLIIVLNGGKRVSIDLASYNIRKKDIMGIIQEASGKDIGYKDTVDLTHEKEVERKKRKSMLIWSIIGVIIFLFFFWLFKS
jgi:hypothetical protein